MSTENSNTNSRTHDFKNTPVALRTSVADAIMAEVAIKVQHRIDDTHRQMRNKQTFSILAWTPLRVVE